jgi:hypothetical protein
LHRPEFLKDFSQAAQHPPTTMKTQHIAPLLNLAPLFKVSIAQARRHGLDEIRISVPRAKEILHDIVVAGKAIKENR